MPERGARTKYQRCASGRLRCVLVPSVLSIGLALNGACRAHVPAPVQPPPSEPVGDLLRPDGIYPIGRPSPNDFPPEPVDSRPEPESTAADVRRAIVSCNAVELRQTILSYRELVALTASRPPVEADYAALADEWIAARMREFCFSGKRGGTFNLGEPETGSCVAAAAGEKWTQSLMLCLITLQKCELASAAPTNESITFTLVDFNHSWRILLRAYDR